MRAHTWGRARKSLGALLAGVLLTSGLAAVTVGAAAPASADTSPSDPALPATVAADALPTVQINGVVWSQVVVGTKVWAVGGFTKARPAGSAPGVNEVDRRNVVVYDIRTGVRDAAFAESLNATGQVVAVSPDGRRVYVGGDFTSASGVRHERIVAFDSATGRVVHSFAAHLDQRVSAIAATNDTVYVGGSFLTANGVPRTRLAAFRAADGALLAWAPTAQEQQVSSLVLAQDARTLYAGGKFTGLNGNGIRGLGALDPVTGVTKPLPVASVISNGGDAGGITSLSVDDDTLYGTGFTFGALSVGNLEGVFAARLSDGQLSWVADCHGDHYSSATIGGVVYAAGHAHYCGNIDSFGQTDPWRFDRALAFTKAATGTVVPNAVGVGRYFDFGGKPRPTALHWYPFLDAGTYTGQNQGPWSVAGNADYVVYGGEFTRAMNTAQQGLVRFARPGLAPNKVGPQSGATLTPTLTTLTPGSVRVTWRTSWDYDNRALTYRVVRNGAVSAPVHTRTVESKQYDRPFLSFTDTAVTPGSTYSYRIYVTDPRGNENRGSTVSTTVVGGTPAGAYAERARTDGALHLWRLGETSGAGRDWGTAGDDLTVGTGVTRGVPGAVTGSTDPAAQFTGTATSTAASAGAVMGAQTFTVEAWVKTSGTAGGKIIGFGSHATGSSTTYDRHLYVDSGGRVSFGVNPFQARVLRSPAVVNDNAWHHVVGTLGAGGQRLYVDGQLVAQNTASTSAQPFTGYWRVGGDNLGGWPNRPTNAYLNGSLDEVAVYGSVLSAQQVAAHHALGRGQAPANVAPTAAFTEQATFLQVAFDGRTSSDSDGTVAGYSWSFGDGTSGTGPTPSKTYAQAGTYAVTLTVTDDKGATGAVTRQVTVAAEPPNQAPAASFTATPADLAVQVDGSGSTDADGSVTGWAWAFGDGGTASGATALHTYAAAGTYSVRLTVTDDDGATATTTRQVTVTAPAVVQVYGRDSFTRTLTNGWGLAETGGTWGLSGGTAADYSVSGGTGRTVLPAGGQTRSVYLPGAQGASTETRVSVSTDKVQTGGGTYVSVIGRRVGTADYRAKLRYLPNGTVTASLVRNQAGETTFTSATVPGLTVTAGQRLQVRFQVSGASPTTLAMKVWPVGSTEPAAWTLTASDSSAGLQQAGSVGLSAYLSGTVTNAPMTVSYDDLWAGTLGGPQQ